MLEPGLGKFLEEDLLPGDWNHAVIDFLSEEVRRLGLHTDFSNIAPTLVLYSRVLIFF